MNYLLNNIDFELWKKFKAKCAGEGKTIREVLIKMIADYVRRK